MPIEALELDGDAAARRRGGRARVQAAGHLADGAAVGHVRQDRELVAAEAGQDVVRAQEPRRRTATSDEQAGRPARGPSCR
jgi:hypothetical protein